MERRRAIAKRRGSHRKHKQTVVRKYRTSIFTFVATALVLVVPGVYMFMPASQSGGASTAVAPAAQTAGEQQAVADATLEVLTPEDREQQETQMTPESTAYVAMNSLLESPEEDMATKFPLNNGVRVNQALTEARNYEQQVNDEQEFTTNLNKSLDSITARATTPDATPNASSELQEFAIAKGFSVVEEAQQEQHLLVPGGPGEDAQKIDLEDEFSPAVAAANQPSGTDLEAVIDIASMNITDENTMTTGPSEAELAETAKQEEQAKDEQTVDDSHDVELVDDDEAQLTDEQKKAKEKNLTDLEKRRAEITEDLQHGVSSEQVKVLQKRLMDLEYMDADEPGKLFGDLTKSAVEAFQSRNEIDPTGMADQATLDAIFEPNAVPFGLTVGDDGDAVTEIQQRLHDMGYRVEVTGTFDEDTRSAVTAFQRVNGQNTTGAVDSGLKELLYMASAQDADGEEYGIGTGAETEGPSYNYNGQFDSGRLDVDAFIASAYAQMGKPYVTGGKGPDVFDCSGLVYYCLNQSGYKIGYQTSAMWRASNYEYVANMKDLLPGDICTFVGHVGIYIGNGRMIDASSSQGKIRVSSVIWESSYWVSHWDGGRRVR